MMLRAVNGLLLAAFLAPFAACAKPGGADLRLFTGRRVELGYRQDGSAYRRVTFERCERPDQIRLGAPHEQLLEFAIMLPDGSIDVADADTLRRIERDDVQIRIYDDRVEYHRPEAPMPDLLAVGEESAGEASGGPCLSFE